MDLALLRAATAGAAKRERGPGMKVKDLLPRCLKAGPLVAALSLGLALSACDKCFDFPWNQPGSCKTAPAPN